ncbi:hypothetical protein T484DRAFT_2328752 [Baffinella frigidus]|nr:hypothetical protein T484DRAFT_2328752 [Cryptophyta sp. CCMP2293]
MIMCWLTASITIPTWTSSTAPIRSRQSTARPPTGTPRATRGGRTASGTDNGCALHFSGWELRGARESRRHKLEQTKFGGPGHEEEGGRR